jgi:glucose-6-phosphate isomerase, archaeal
MNTSSAFSTDFDLHTGLSSRAQPLHRRLSDMRGMFADSAALDAAIAREDALVYTFYDLGVPDTPHAVAHGTSVIYPGKVSDEYFMTKGHFHTELECAEVYYGLRGRGVILLENPEGDWDAREIAPGIAVYIPGRYAHRSINTSLDEPLVFFFALAGNAGHDYGTIATRGFCKRLVERDGTPAIIDNGHRRPV